MKSIQQSGSSILALVQGLSRIGWEIRDLDLDLVDGRATVEVHRSDGRWVRLHVDAIGRTSIERWHRTIELGRGTLVGRVARSPQIEDTFLGRVRCEGARDGLRRLSAYVAKNPAPGRAPLLASDVRGLFAPLMGEEERPSLEGLLRDAGAPPKGSATKLSTLLAGAGAPEGALPPERYRNLGIDDEVVVCEHCGKTNLKCTVVLGILDKDGNVLSEARFGRDCAARALRPSAARKSGAAEKMEKEARQVTLTRLRAQAPRNPDVQVKRGGWTTASRWPLPDGRYLVQQLGYPWSPAEEWGGTWKELVTGSWWLGRPAGR